MGSACSLNDDETELKGVVKSRVQLRPDHRRPVKPRSEMGPPELLEASLLGDMKQAGWVLETDGNAHGVPTCTGWLPLHVCAAQGHLDIARALLRRKAEVNPPSDSLSAISPLSLACLSGQASLVQLLLCAAATIDGPEGHGGAPLLHAAYKNFASICEILLDSGANPHVAFTKSGHIQLEIPAAKTPLHDDHWHRILCEPSQGGSSLQQLRTEGVTALHLAAWHGSARTCWALLGASARPDARDCLHRSALMLSAERGHLEVVRLLLERRAHLHPSLHGHTAASLAARANQTAAVELLLEGKVDVDYVAWFGAPTMLHIAAYWRYQGLVSKLLTLKANTESPLAPGGLRPLMVAADRGSLEVCQLLLGFSAEVGALDDAGESAWQKAVLAGNLKIGHLLAACGAASALKVGPSRGEKEASEV